jgi:hypothetical protein
MTVIDDSNGTKAKGVKCDDNEYCTYGGFGSENCGI